VNPGAAPLEAPDGIAPERHVPRQTVGTAVEGGLDPDLGAGVPLGIEIGDAMGPPPPPEPPKVVAPVRIGGLIREPRRIAYVSPVYPLIAQAVRLEGDVVLEAIIGTDGSVQDLRVVRSSPLLDEAAVEAVRQWRYTPTLLNGTPVPVVMTVRVSFRLR
jgi:protein TonB